MFNFTFFNSDFMISQNVELLENARKIIGTYAKEVIRKEGINWASGYALLEYGWIIQIIGESYEKEIGSLEATVAYMQSFDLVLKKFKFELKKPFTVEESIEKQVAVTKDVEFRIAQVSRDLYAEKLYKLVEKMAKEQGTDDIQPNTCNSSVQ